MEHLGGGIYVTTNDKYPVLDIRHQWQPVEADKPSPTKKGGKNSHELKAWMKAFVVQDSEDINVDPGDKPVLQTQGTTSPWPLKLLFFFWFFRTKTWKRGGNL